jgi:hypothetical protein
MRFWLLRAEPCEEAARKHCKWYFLEIQREDGMRRRFLLGLN